MIEVESAASIDSPSRLGKDSYYFKFFGILATFLAFSTMFEWTFGLISSSTVAARLVVYLLGFIFQYFIFGDKFFRFYDYETAIQKKEKTALLFGQ